MTWRSRAVTVNTEAGSSWRSRAKPITAQNEDGESKDLSIGDSAKKAYDVANVPSRKAREGLKMLTDMIPDPQTKSAALNFALGTPKTLLEVGSELSASSISPESLATMGLAKIPIAKGIQAVRGAARNVMPPVQQALTGVNKINYQRIFDRPGILKPKMSLNPSGKEAAGKALGEAEKRAFGDVRPTAREVNDPMLSQARKQAIKTVEVLDRVEQLPEQAQRAIFSNPDMGREILKARRATDVMLGSPAAKGSQRAFLEEQKARLNGLLERFYPDVREKSLGYAEAATRDSVYRALPVLKSGDPSVARLFMAAVGRTAGVPLGLSSPALNAGATALTRLSLDALEKMAQVPRMRELVLAEIARRRSNETSQPD